MKGLDYAAFSQRLHETAMRERIPLVGAMALTYRCNLVCAHCYLDGCRSADELACEEWLEIIDQVAAAGCLWFVISGGEPLVRPDFARIYRHARERGMLVGVFTNGTLIDDELVEMWRECPPYVVEVSLYGYARETYAEVTGSTTARDAAFAGVRRLARAGIPTRLKSMMLRQNATEIEALRGFAAELGLEFRSDAMVSSGLHGSKKPLASRLDDDRLLRLDAEDDRAQQGWSRFFSCHGEPAARQSLFSCGGGSKFFFLDPSARLGLCPFDIPSYDVRQGSFLAGWNGPIRDRRSAALPDDHACAGCRDYVFCGVCPPVARMETGSELGRPSSLCELGRQRSSAIRSHAKPSPLPSDGALGE